MKFRRSWTVWLWLNRPIIGRASPGILIWILPDGWPSLTETASWASFKSFSISSNECGFVGGGSNSTTSLPVSLLSPTTFGTIDPRRTPDPENGFCFGWTYYRITETCKLVMTFMLIFSKRVTRLFVIIISMSSRYIHYIYYSR